MDTGTVIDVQVLSRYCNCLDKEKHNQNCTANYSGCRGGMEAIGVVDIFSRSVQKCINARYINYLGDSDIASYKTVADKKPYGEGIQINKFKCKNNK